MSDTKQPIKKHSVRPETPAPTTATPEQISLVPWDDGKLFKFMKGHTREGGDVFPILARQATKEEPGFKVIQVAATPHFEIADLIANCVNLVTESAKQGPQPETGNKTNES